MRKGLRRELSVLLGFASAGLMLKNKPAGLGLGAVALGLGLLNTKEFSFKDSVVFITGGSRGLGFALAQKILSLGGRVFLVARTTHDLENAKDKLQQEYPSERVATFTCDVTDPVAMKEAIESAQNRYGRIDVLINNAGSITVGPFETFNQTDFYALLDLQVGAVLNATHLALPVFKKQGAGRIINISSIGGKLPLPHMSSYSTAKFAIAGLSETLNAELAPYNVTVTTVYAGLMQTGSPIQAVIKGDSEKEFAWFNVGNMSPIVSVKADKAAEIIIEACRNGDAQVTFPLITQAAVLGHTLFPESYALINRVVTRLMPDSDSTVRKTGAESKGLLDKQTWYQILFGKTARQNQENYNQIEKSDAEYNSGIVSQK